MAATVAAIMACTVTSRSGVGVGVFVGAGVSVGRAKATAAAMVAAKFGVSVGAASSCFGEVQPVRTANTRTKAMPTKANRIVILNRFRMRFL